MKNSVITSFENKFLPKNRIHPTFRPGDTLRVHYKLEETTKGSKGTKKYRIQVYEGVCIRFKKGTANSSFTVRKIGANSIGVERVFPLHSKLIDKITIISSGTVKRARLYYLRDLSGKAARIKPRRVSLEATSTVVTSTEKASAPKETTAKETKAPAPKATTAKETKKK